jgi:hypothetical protein
MGNGFLEDEEMEQYILGCDDRRWTRIVLNVREPVSNLRPLLLEMCRAQNTPHWELSQNHLYRLRQVFAFVTQAWSGIVCTMTQSFHRCAARMRTSGASVVSQFLHCLFPNFFFYRTSVHHFKTDPQNGKRKHTSSQRPRKRRSSENIYWPHSRSTVSLVMFTCFLTLSLSCPAKELSARKVKDVWR